MSRAALERRQNPATPAAQAASNAASVPLPVPAPAPPLAGTISLAMNPYPQHPVVYPNYQQPYMQPMTYPAPHFPAVTAVPNVMGVVRANAAEPRKPKEGELPIHNNQTTFNVNQLLFNNILESDYFKSLYTLTAFHEVVNEIYEKVEHVEPWSTGTSRIPSTAFCLLMKLFTMRLTAKQMDELLNDTDSPLIRCLGFLYLRYTCPPTDLWSWFEPYLEDDEVVNPCSDPEVSTTIGQYCLKLLTELQYYRTPLPRIPVLIERKIKVMILLLEQKQRRRKENSRIQDKLQAGAKVRAIYTDETSGPQWYDAVIDRVNDDGSYQVTFEGYGNTEVVDLGDIQLPDEPAGRSSRSRDRDDRKERSSSRSRRRERSSSRNRRRRSDSRDGRRDKGRDSRDRSRSRDRRRSRSAGRDGTEMNLMDEVLRRERAKHAATGKDYASRPASYKGSLSLKQDRYTYRKKSKSRSPPPLSRRPAGRGRSRSPDAPQAQAPRQPSAALLEKRRKLLEQYGDASANASANT